MSAAAQAQAQTKPKDVLPPAVAASAAATTQRVEVKGENTEIDQRRREPVAKQIYGREELEKYGDTNVTDVLKRLPGVNISGGAPRLRGMGAGYTQILVNGEPAPPGFSLDNLSPAQVERIEVSKGPTAEFSAQAVAGTINIILREAPKQRQRELRMGLGHYPGAKLGGSVNATYGDKLGGLSWVLPMSLFQWASNSDTTTQSVTRDVAQSLQRQLGLAHNQGWGHGLNLSPRLTWKLSDSDSLNWQSFIHQTSFHNRNSYQVDVQDGIPPPSVNDHTVNDGRWTMLRSNLQAIRKWADGARLEAKLGLQATHAHSDSTMRGLNATDDLTVLRLTVRDERDNNWTSSGKFSWPMGDQHSLAVGWDVERRDRTELRDVQENGAPQLLGYDGVPFKAHISRNAAYVQDEWELSPQWSTYLGLRAEQIDTDSASAGDLLRNRSQVISPLWHVNYKLDPRGRDQIRASLTRSYKAPNLASLLARPSVATAYPLDSANTAVSPDRVGNPALKPELATGLDVAFEKYLQNGGLISLSVFHRRIDGLIRTVVGQGPQAVSWASAPRWVSSPVNLGRARSSGAELEIKGRAGELMPQWFNASTGLNLRAALSYYRSSVDGLPAPHNRLDSQQPWSMTLGFDRTAQGTPLAWGGSLAYTPGYLVQQSNSQVDETGRVRTVDVYANWTFSPSASLRVALADVAPLSVTSASTVTEASGTRLGSQSRTDARMRINMNLTLKF